MKKTLYMLLLSITAIVCGGLIGKVAKGSLKWLGYSKTFSFMRDGNVIDTSVFKLNFGFYISANVAQILCILVAIFVYYKTAPKIFTGK